MDYGKLLARAFEITKNYRALWFFGILLAIFGGGGGGSFNFPSSGGGGGGNGRGGDVFPTTANLPPGLWQNLTLIIFAVICIVLILSILSIILRFLSRAALIGLVAELESAGTTPAVRRGFSIGAERFWSQLGVAFVINLPLVILTLAIILIALAPILVTMMPLLNATPGSPDLDEMFGVLMAGLWGSIVVICCAAICVTAIHFIITPFYQFILRACVIGKRGVMDSIREGYRQVRANLKDVAVLYILVIGIGIGFTILMIPVALILIGIPVGAAIALGLSTQSWQIPIVLGVCLGIPLFVLMIFISGLFQVFESTVWTEGYLAITAPKQIAQSTPPA